MNYRNKSPQNTIIKTDPNKDNNSLVMDGALSPNSRLNLPKFQEEKKRQDFERSRENFLRTSLTKSQKLRSLADKIKTDSTRASFDNRGYTKDDETKKGIYSLQPPMLIDDLRKKRAFDQLNGSKRINPQEWEWLDNYFHSKEFSTTFKLHQTISHKIEQFKSKIPDYSKYHWMIGKSSFKSSKELEMYLNRILDRCKNIDASDIDSLSNSKDNQAQITELIEIFNKNHFKNFLYTFDKVVSICINDWQPVEDEKRLTIIDETNKPLDSDDEDRRKTREIRGTTDVHKTPVAGCYWTEIESNNGVKLKRIILHKPRNCHLGITVKNVGASIIINRIMKGSMSDISDVFTEGDELVALNGQEMVSEDVDFIHDIFSEQANQLELIVLPSRDMFAKMTKSLTNESSIYLRSLFSYDPESDVYLPCKDVGLAFTKGGIIEVRSIKDSFWWQAYRLEAGNVREGPIDSRLCGLIPSPQYQYNRTIARILTGGLTDEFEVTNGYLDEEFSKDLTFNILNAFSSHTDFVWMKNAGGAYSIYKERAKGLPEVTDLTRESLNIWCRSGIIWGQLGYSLGDMHSVKKGPRLTKTKSVNDSLKFSSGQDADDPVAWLDEDEIIHSINRPCLFTYEPVVEFYPQPQRRRILVIVGSALVGKTQVIEKLINYDSRRFVLPKILTTCETMNLNTPNQKYEVISQGTFEAMFREDAFVEIGYFNKCFYGILKSTLEEIVKMGRVAVVNLRPESLRRMRKTGLLPFVVCLSPPNSGNELRRSRSIFDPNYTCSMEELKYCIESNMYYETMYGHWYDYVEPVYDIDESVKTIHEVVVRLEREKQWIPRHWLKMAQGLAHKNKIEYTATKIFNTDISIV